MKAKEFDKKFGNHSGCCPETARFDEL